jgi:hypothetical protein
MPLELKLLHNKNSQTLPYPKSLPPAQDVNAEQSLEMPSLYVAGQKDELFNYCVFLQAIAHGMVTSLVNFFMTVWASQDTAGPASLSDYQSFAVVVALSGLLSVTIEVGRITPSSPHPVPFKALSPADFCFGGPTRYSSCNLGFGVWTQTLNPS